MFDIFGGIGSYYGQKEANESNERMSKEQMSFQRYMSNTSHQRGQADLRKAGLNPILSATGGNASTPTGSQAHVENALGAGISTALEAKRLKADLDKIHSEVEQNKANTEVSKSSKKLIESQIPGAQGKSQVDAALGKTAQILQPYLNKVQKLTQPSQNAAPKDTKPVLLKTKD